MHHSIEIYNLSYTYPDGHQALHDVSLKIERCEKVALVGPNGAGKSTLILHLIGILTGQGEVRAGGLPVVKENLAQVRARLGLVFQSPEDQQFSPTVHDDVAYGPLYQGLPQAEVDQPSSSSRARIQSRKSFLIPSLITGGPQFVPAFSRDEQIALAPQLSRALADAKSDELITFYRRVSTSAVGLAITSGGLFVHDQYLYVILANARTLPSEGMREGLMTEIDPVDNPLQPISQMSFRATFVPATSMVPEDERLVWPYIDQGRVVVIDLVQLGRDMRSPAPRAMP